MGVLFCYQGVQDDITTMQPTVEAITEVSRNLRSQADPSFSSRLQAEVDQTLGRWSAIIELSRQHTGKLSSAIEETRVLFNDIGSLDSWLDDIKAGHLSCELVVHNEVELGQYISNFQVLLLFSTPAPIITQRILILRWLLDSKGNRFCYRAEGTFCARKNASNTVKERHWASIGSQCETMGRLSCTEA